MKYPIPTKAGFFWAYLRNKNANIKLTGIIKVSGDSPFLTQEWIWQCAPPELNSTNIQEMMDVLEVQWGPEIEYPKKFAEEMGFYIPYDIFEAIYPDQ